MKGEKVQFEFIDKSVKVLEGLRKDWNVTDYWKECEECRKSFIDAIKNNYGDIQKTRSETLNFKNELIEIGEIKDEEKLKEFLKVVNKFKVTIKTQAGAVRKLFGHTSLFATPENREKLQKLLNEFNAFYKKNTLLEDFIGHPDFNGIYTFGNFKKTYLEVLRLLKGDEEVEKIYNKIAPKVKGKADDEFMTSDFLKFTENELKKCTSSMPSIENITNYLIICVKCSLASIEYFEDCINDVKSVICVDMEVGVNVAASNLKNEKAQQLYELCENEIKRRLTEGGINSTDQHTINNIGAGHYRTFNEIGNIRDCIKTVNIKNCKKHIDYFDNFIQEFKKI